MAIEILPDRVLIKNKDASQVEFKSANPLTVSTYTPRGLGNIKVHRHDLGLLIQALKAFHNTGSFVVGE